MILQRRSRYAYRHSGNNRTDAVLRVVFCLFCLLAARTAGGACRSCIGSRGCDPGVAAAFVSTTSGCEGHLKRKKRTSINADDTTISAAGIFTSKTPARRKRQSCTHTSLHAQNHDDDNDMYSIEPTAGATKTVKQSGDNRLRHRHRRLQMREQPNKAKRKKPYYWLNVSNVDCELRKLWLSHNVTIDKNQPPPIPNELLLTQWKRHDLRHAIVVNGGRDELSKLLGGASILSGKRKVALQQTQDNNDMQQLLLRIEQQQQAQKRQRRSGTEDENQTKLKQMKENDTNNMMISVEDRTTDTSSESSPTRSRSPVTTRRMRHRKDRVGQWNEESVLRELYNYLKLQKETINRPSVFMPRLSELNSNGRTDLRMAISNCFQVTSKTGTTAKYESGDDGTSSYGRPDDISSTSQRTAAGVSKRVCRYGGLITFREWNYFEGLLDMLLELKRYLDQYHDGNYDLFPSLSDIQSRPQNENYDLLYALIRYYGGRKFVASKLGMTSTPATSATSRRNNNNNNRTRKTRSEKQLDLLSTDTMAWGEFDLLFAIDLLSFVREQYLRMEPPLRYPVIQMPTKQYLLFGSTASGANARGKRLHEQIERFGGYENVARRLGLEIFPVKRNIL